MASRIRLGATTGGNPHVDREKGIIYGASATQAVEALGHELQLDQVTLLQVAQLGNNPVSPNGRSRDGIKVRFTHPGLSSDGLGKLAARARNFRVEGDKTLCDLHFVDRAYHAKVEGGESMAEYIMGLAEEAPEQFGLSIVFRGYGVWTMADGSERKADKMSKPPEGASTKYPVVRIEQLDAVDFVDEPAANRSGLFGEPGFLCRTNLDAEEAFDIIDDYLEQTGYTPEKVLEVARRYSAARGVEQKDSDMPQEEQNFELSAGTGEDTFVPVTPAPVADQGALAALNARIEKLQKESDLNAFKLKLAQSGLSADGQEAVLSAVDGGLAFDKADTLIAAQRKLEAKLAEASTIRGVVPSEGRVNGMLSAEDKLTEAFSALLDGRRPEKGLKPITGIREAYTLFSGDYEMTGVFQPQNVGFAAITTSTMPLIMANVLNKKVVSMFNMYNRWWEKITVQDDAANMQQMRWYKIGGIGEMPTVQEGATYTETTWSEDYETADWNKKGHYLGLTLESIDKDDTRKLLEAPRALAQSAYLTISKDVSRLFTTNSGNGPTMRDGVAWFHANHSNKGNSALSYSSLKATTVLMRKQTELGTGERLTGGLNRPKYYLVPIDLENTALEILSSTLDPSEGTVTSYQKNNIMGTTLAAAQEKLIVMDHWTDASDWVAIADPNLFPSIGLSFRFGREPELFSVADPNSGLMFTNDTMPIKVRWFYSLGIIDYKGVYKHVV